MNRTSPKARPESAPDNDGHHQWRFVTNHAHVLEAIADDPTIRLRDVAGIVGITERTAASIVDDLVAAGYLTKIREGRRNRYVVQAGLPLRHPQHSHRTVGELIRFLQRNETPPRNRSAATSNRRRM
jgi:predicted transcriptional regulator